MKVNTTPIDDPEMMYLDKYNTKLSDSEEIEFRKWVDQESSRQGRNISMDLGAYDLRGFWKSGDYKNMDEDNHGSDKWKKPNHPTFSNQSVYHNVDGQAGGVWTDNGGYQPSAHTLSLYDTGYYDWLFGAEPHRPEHLDLSRSTIVPKPSISPSTFKYSKGGYVSPIMRHYKDGGEIDPPKYNKLAPSPYARKPGESENEYYRRVGQIDAIKPAYPELNFIGVGAVAKQGFNLAKNAPTLLQRAGKYIVPALNWIPEAYTVLDSNFKNGGKFNPLKIKR